MSLSNSKIVKNDNIKKKYDIAFVKTKSKSA